MSNSKTPERGGARASIRVSTLLAVGVGISAVVFQSLPITNLGNAFNRSVVDRERQSDDRTYDTKVLDLLRNLSGSDFDASRKLPAYVAKRKSGELIKASWRTTNTDRHSVANALDAVHTSAISDLGNTYSLEVFITTARRAITRRDGSETFGNVHRGVLGLEVEQAGKRAQVSPTEMIARNLSFENALNVCSSRLGEQGVMPNTDRMSIHLLVGRQFLIQFGSALSGAEMFRGNSLVELQHVTAKQVHEFTNGLASWLVRHVDSDGRMVYKYWPSRGEESRSNNMIRQFMATLALNKWASHSGDDAARAAAVRNLRYNLGAYYVQEGAYGIIEYDGKAKLGAIALAALAIRTSSERTKYIEEEESLVRTVENLWDANTGAFRTFWRPRERNDNQNFYPGEALLLWANIIDEEGDTRYIEKFMRSFLHYRNWHRMNKNPAFIPWHTQAYYTVWNTTQDEALRDFIFEMNDWLVGTQQWEQIRYADIGGRFFDPTLRGYGPPHASSTGVYIEGLADAYVLAVEVDDEIRAKRYKRAILRGLRSTMQLQYVDDVDMYYVFKRDRVRGGLRTTVYNNEIRVDNVQHSLDACLKVKNALFANAQI